MGRTSKRGRGHKKKRGNGGARSAAGSVARRRAESLRFRIGSRVECRVGDGWVTGTVVKLFYDTEFDDYGIVPYQLQCDDGSLRFAPCDAEDTIRASTSSPMPIKYAAGTRVRFKFWEKGTGSWRMGTVLSANADWADELDWSTGTNIMANDSPYAIHFDDSGKIASFYGPEQWVQFSAPPMPVNINRNARVKCKLFPDKERWRLGTVIAADSDWVEKGCSPYYIHFDDGTKGHFYGPEEDIQEVELRFKVGDRVEIERGALISTGTIVKLWGLTDLGEEEEKLPFEVRLDDGSLSHAFVDTDEYVRASTTPPLSIKHSRGTRVECKMDDGVWRQGTVVTSNKDWAEHDRPPYYIRIVSDGGEPQYEGFWGPEDSIRECTLSDITADFEHLAMFGTDDSDDELFAPPPLRGDCPICFIPLPIECDQYHDTVCCGNTICTGCLFSLQHHENESQRICPFCRSSLIMSNEKHLALRWKRVQLGDPEATFCMGCHYSTGAYGLQKDEEKAFDLYLRAADLGSPRALTNVGVAYNSGKIVGKNESKERYYLEKAAKLGEVHARCGLATLEGENNNVELQLRHTKIAAVQGYTPALSNILYFYQIGMLGKNEYTDILRASQRSKEMEWSKDRDVANQKSNDPYSIDD